MILDIMAFVCMARYMLEFLSTLLKISQLIYGECPDAKLVGNFHKNNVWKFGQKAIFQ